jgi:MFS family permease
MDKILAPWKQSRLVNALFFSNIYLSFHYYLIIYINSTYLSNYFSEAQISTLYIIQASLNVILLINLPKILNKVGNYKIAIWMAVLEILATLGLAVSSVSFLIAIYFVIHSVAVATLSVNLDMFLESSEPDEAKTGEIRGMYLTIGNVIIIICALAVSFLLARHGYPLVYALSAVFMIPFWIWIRKYFRHSRSEPLQHIRIRETVLEYAKNKDLSNIWVVQFLLQFFYSFMVIYMPLYLLKVIGFSWTEIGMIFAIMLLPFVLFEIPVGDLADEKYGEKEFLAIGLLIMGLSTIFISFITAKSFWMWAAILFITRIGASFVEITSDSYFFKHVDGSSTGTISSYRLTRPLATIAAPIVATLALQFIPFEYTFILVGGLMVVGTRYALALKDTK